jgi:hypothetical protein
MRWLVRGTLMKREREGLSALVYFMTLYATAIRCQPILKPLDGGQPAWLPKTEVNTLRASNRL